MDSSWFSTGTTLKDNQSSGANTFMLFAKIFPAGPVSLGPSDNGSNDNMYTVIVLGLGTGGGGTPTPTPTTPPTPTATPSTTPTTPPTLQLNNLVVSDSANKTNWSLENGIAVGTVQYGDRGYTISSLPTTLNGAAWVETANSSKTFTGNTIVSFTINVSATVYVALDTRDAVPSWMSSWHNTGMTLTDNQSSGTNTFNLYSMTFGAGTVTLGPNDKGNTYLNMYTIIVV